MLARYKLTTMEDDRAGRFDRADVTKRDAMRSSIWLLRSVLRLGRDVRELDASLAAIEGHGPGVVPALRDLAPSRRAFVSWLNHLFGAYNAVDYAITAALVLLERHPAIRAELREELDANAERAGGPNALAELPLLHAFAQEVFRVAPVANVTLRTLGAPVEIDGIRFDQGTELAIGACALHHDPRSWREPERFDPRRWMGAEAPHPPFAYVPFLLGPRRCWGRPLAEMVFAEVLRETLVHHELRVDDPTIGWTEYYMPRFSRSVRATVSARALSKHQAS